MINKYFIFFRDEILKLYTLKKEPCEEDNYKQLLYYSIQTDEELFGMYFNNNGLVSKNEAINYFNDATSKIKDLKTYNEKYTMVCVGIIAFNVFDNKRT